MAAIEVVIPDELAEQPEPARLQLAGIRFWMGKMKAIVSVLPIKDIVQLAADTVIFREDFKLRSKVPGNRMVRSEWVERIKRGIKENADRLLLGTFIFALDPIGIVAEAWPDPDQGGFLLDVKRVGLRSGFKLWILDAQHRSRAIQKLWDEVLRAVADGDLDAQEVARLLGRSSVPIVIVLEKDPRHIRRMFVAMASTRPIPTALVVAMDEFRTVNRLGTMVAEQSQLLSNGGPASRLEYHSGTPKAEKVFTAAVVRTGASVSLIGFKDRSPQQRDDNIDQALKEFGTTQEAALKKAASWIADSWNYAAKKMPGWRDILTDKKTPEQVRLEYLVGSGAALYVIAAVVAACRLAGIDYKPAIDAVAELPWRRADVAPAIDPLTGKPTISHKFFEGLLTNSVLVNHTDGSVKEQYRTAGGNRTQYQGATRKVLDFLAQDARFASLTGPDVLQGLGLEASGRRGRPSKAA